MKKQNLLFGVMWVIFMALLTACDSSQMMVTIATPPSEPTATSPSPERATADDHQPNRPLLMAHYMPWYQSPSVSGYWGWHWTMDHFRPARQDENGRPELASHFTPLTGPYDSRDEALLEYQILLMKISGIDGVIVDWYGIEDFWDYAVLNKSTHKLFETIEKADLKFAIMYEDQTIKHMIANKHLNGQDDLAHGHTVIRYLQDTWFGETAYLKVSDQPLLFTFGPQYFKNAADWEDLFADLNSPPALITLDRHTESAAMSTFPWPPMWASKDGVLTRPILEDYLSEYYNKVEDRDYIVGGAFPGFKDIYQEAGVGDSYGYLDAEAGETFRFTLETALKEDPDVIQLITWNDYGEGTIIEPTEEFGYLYLEMVQEVRRAGSAEAFPFEAEDLHLPLQLFNLRKTYARQTEVKVRLDEAAAAILAGDVESATDIVAHYSEASQKIE